jgi:hypothetical protein
VKVGISAFDPSFPKIPSGLDSHRKAQIIASLRAMFAILHALGMSACELLKSPDCITNTGGYGFPKGNLLSARAALLQLAAERQ